MRRRKPAEVSLLLPLRPATFALASKRLLRANLGSRRTMSPLKLHPLRWLLRLDSPPPQPAAAASPAAASQLCEPVSAPLTSPLTPLPLHQLASTSAARSVVTYAIVGGGPLELLSLPTELLLTTCGSLDHVALCRLAQASIMCRQLADDPLVWQAVRAAPASATYIPALRARPFSPPPSAATARPVATARSMSAHGGCRSRSVSGRSCCDGSGCASSIYGCGSGGWLEPCRPSAASR